jgi:hypothetical protein
MLLLLLTAAPPCNPTRPVLTHSSVDAVFCRGLRCLFDSDRMICPTAQLSLSLAASALAGAGVCICSQSSALRAGAGSAGARKACFKPRARFASGATQPHKADHVSRKSFRRNR